MSYGIIESNREAGVVETLCGALGVSTSGYYAWRERQPSQHQQTDAVLLEAIKAVYQAGRGLYGSPRIHAALRQQGVCCSRKRVARLMQQAGLHSRRRPKRRIRTTDSRHNRPVAPNLSLYGRKCTRGFHPKWARGFHQNCTRDVHPERTR